MTVAKKMTAQERKRFNSWENYGPSRKGAAYHFYTAAYVAAFGRNAKSIIDVGAHKSDMVEWFTWIPKKCTLDLTEPYSSEHVEAIQTDFSLYETEQKFDLALCLQVLEHIEDAEAFAQKLFSIARDVIISVPYKWPHGHTGSHVHDPVDEAKVESWTHRKPSHSLLVPEPLMRDEVAYRMINYYHHDPKNFSLAHFRKRTRPVPELALPQLTIEVPIPEDPPPLQATTASGPESASTPGANSGAKPTPQFAAVLLGKLFGHR